MIIERSILYHIKEKLTKKPKIIVLYGPRQAGKTTLIKMLLNQYQKKYLYFNGDDLRVQSLWSKPDASLLKKQIGQAELIVIDEAQKIENIAQSLKLIFDTFSPFIVASGSASFDLANKINEPLTGRTETFILYPFSVLEIPVNPPQVSFVERLEEFLRFGLYPEVVLADEEKEKINYLNELINTYLYKDILSFEQIRKPKKVIHLLTFLALQIGNEVSILELANNLSISKIIVEKYLDVLEKMFIIINLGGFSRNLRKEIVKTSKYYFVDLGLRNALIQNFNPLHLRDDVGRLFENFCFIERLKIFANKKEKANFYFWRTYDQKEIDLIEEKQGKLFAFEFKWQEKDKKIPTSSKTFLKTYKNSQFSLITPKNLEKFLKIYFI
uniref:ATP-binding protein n=1 Tax=candidate division CPR3 bacterium TaxID=2268181 RepID=A0A7C4R8N6_UNCC3